jgi:16S rRNA U516 pseudouridylate synthase RsuA-like enzyme
MKDLEEGGFISHSEGKISLTEGGNREIDRLCTLSGLMVARESIKNQPA